MVPSWDIKWPIKYTWQCLKHHTPWHSPCNLRWLGQSWGTHLQLPLGQPLLPGPLANVIRVTSLEGYSGHGPLTKADLPTNSPSQPASTSLFRVLDTKKLATESQFCHPDSALQPTPLQTAASIPLAPTLFAFYGSKKHLLRKVTHVETAVRGWWRALCFGTCRSMSVFESQQFSTF